MADFWFGNLRKAGYFPAPNTGMDADSVGEDDTLSFANGGAYVAQSAGTHREFNFQWGVQEKSVMNFLSEYRNGVHGTGLLYMADPFAVNALPPHWATPGLSCLGWPSIVSSTIKPTRTPSVVRTNETLNPNFTLGVANWNASSAAAVPLTHDAATGRGKLTVVTATAANATIMAETAATAHVLGTLKSARMTVTNARASTAQFKIGIRGYNSAGTMVGTDIFGPTVTIGANSSAEVVVNGANLTTAGTVFYRMLLVAVSTLAVGNIVYVDNALTETAPTVGPYFDGNSVFVDGTAGTWAGIANASFSSIPQAMGPMPNDAATYSLTSTAGLVPDRKLHLLIPPDRDLHIGFSGSATNGAVVRVRPITKEGMYAPVTDLTLLPATGTTRMNARFSGTLYSAIQVYLTTTLPGTGTITLASGKAVYSAVGATPTLTGDHVNGDGHTGFRIGDISTAYIQAADGHQYVTTATKGTEIEAWL